MQAPKKPPQQQPVGNSPGTLRALATIEKERERALSIVKEETWRQTTLGVHFGGSMAFFKHCSPGAAVDPLLVHMRERVGTTAPHGVRLAELLLKVGAARTEGQQQRADELLRQALAEAEVLLGRLRNRDR